MSSAGHVCSLKHVSKDCYSSLLITVAHFAEQNCKGELHLGVKNSSCCPTKLKSLQRQGPLSRGLGAVILHDRKTHKAHVLKVHIELEVLAPHGVESVAVDGFGSKVTAVDGHAQNVQLNAGAPSTVCRTNILPRNNLRHKQA